MGSTTRMVRSARLAADPEIALTVLRLMMAMNDIGVANDGLQEWDATENPKKKNRKDGGKLYFGRMQMAHVHEALLIVKEIERKPSLKRLVDQCDAPTRESFATVVAFLSSKDFKFLEDIRNRAAFHYDRQLPLLVLNQIVRNYPQDVSSYSLGHETLDWYFELGDKVADRIVVREIFHVPETANMREALDAILKRLHAMAMAFSDFAACFIRHYAR
jgi:hypothetical protein